MRFLRILALLLLLPVLAACGAAPGENEGPTAANVARLEAQILALGPGIDPEEAARAARIAYTYPGVLARQYRITDPPLIHNMKVNAGIKPRGLCWQWAEDMEKRLKAEAFETLVIHRAIANSDVAFRIDHSTAIVARKGDGWSEGLILDPWRWGGVLYWGAVPDDEEYRWRARGDVLEERRREAQRDRGRAG